MISAILAAAILLAETTPAAAGSHPAATPVAAPGPKVNKDGMICHTEEVLGSRIPTRVCMTPEQEAQRRQQDREMTEHMQSQNGYTQH